MKQQRHWEERTHQWLLKTEFRNASEAEISELKDILRFHEHRYYVLNEPLISDTEYDRLYKMLEAAERNDPTIITPDSPTQRVGSGLTASFHSVSHLVPMLSLENSYNASNPNSMAPAYHSSSKEIGSQGVRPGATACKEMISLPTSGGSARCHYPPVSQGSGSARSKSGGKC